MKMKNRLAHEKCEGIVRAGEDLFVCLRASSCVSWTDEVPG